MTGPARETTGRGRGPTGTASRARWSPGAGCSRCWDRRPTATLVRSPGLAVLLRDGDEARASAGAGGIRPVGRARASCWTSWKATATVSTHHGDSRRAPARQGLHGPGPEGAGRAGAGTERAPRAGAGLAAGDGEFSPGSSAHRASGELGLGSGPGCGALGGGGEAPPQGAEGPRRARGPARREPDRRICARLLSRVRPRAGRRQRAASPAAPPTRGDRVLRSRV